ncbi:MULTISPECIES: Gfo/Idh/MocA family protein [Actinomadura]|uniref:Myo-inositol 2-dehydrogenase / D-chiro-inositol 1-dehydrogenase n=1 Tax=Actinomadura madurae TaxID=1993 RepID=A0A1I5A1T6_9ACTN|nr:Gfo/Idh/MocA family oxidoreductase [Actinomadura madurae]SFN56386.1 myo-inositol 2-dehydrogenase / D-chiro-inositol 1-dehydrogenase [Actinomadura madurae]SPT56908.1 Inositol 2-dehydrogenase [Actinomadura madurae]
MRIGLAGAGRIGARHAAALCELPDVDALVIADADPGRARDLAGRLPPGRGATALDGVEALFSAGLDGLVVAAATDAHAGLVERALAAGNPVFCEKPLASDLDGTFQIVRAAAAAGVPVQVGFQRRFDVGNAAAREALASGRLGWLHTVRSCSFDPAPPPPGYVPSSGGLFRDCVIHDLDLIRFVTGREVVRVMAAGANRGDDFFREYGDVDTGSALLVLDDGTLGQVSATRYNAAGYDARLELFGSKDSIVTGLDGRTPVTALPERGEEPEPAYSGFMDRFSDAYDAELRAFVDVVAGRRANPCPPEDALEAFYLAEACELSMRQGRIVGTEEVRR